MMKPCLEEEWFVEDCLESGFLSNHPFVHMFGNSREESLREIYRLSRSIRIRHILAGRFQEARETGHTAVLGVMESLTCMIGMAIGGLKQQQPHLFESDMECK